MDTLRGDDREINHHGVMRSVGEEDEKTTEVTPVEKINKVSAMDLRHRREDLEVAARKEFYKKLREGEKNKEKLIKCKKIGRVYIPTVITIFVVIYWGFGLSQMK